MKLLLRVKNYRIVFLFFVVLTISCEKQSKKRKSKVVETSRVAHLPYYKDESFTPYWLTPGTKEVQEFHAIPDFKLVNQLGDSISQKAFEDKIYITDFFFATCPGICPKMTRNMFKIQEEFKNDSSIMLLSHSVTPSIDSVHVLNNYAKNHGVIANKWHLATGNKKQIYDLGRDHYFVENDLGEEKSIEDFLHTENFLLIDKNKHIRGLYNGLNRASINQLITDVKALRKE